MMTGAARSAVFLDRDGVINRAVVRAGLPFPPSRADDVELIPGVVEACFSLQKAGALLFCVTNQPDVARGIAQREDIEAINLSLQRTLGLDDVAVCYHDDKDGCACRKPKPGMLINLAARYEINLERSVMVGDRWRDVEAGIRAGCRTVFIDYGYNEERPTKVDWIDGSLAQALPWILNFLSAGKSR
jgi:D-glycero-D-manno-heptose 1,7-bisphosphate phosphatase